MNRATAAAKRSVMDSPCHYSMPSTSTPDMNPIKTEFTPSPHLRDHQYGATPQAQIYAAYGQQPPSVKRKLNMDTKQINIIPHIKQEFKAPPPKRPKKMAAALLQPASPAALGKKSSRHDTSLCLLTERFRKLLDASPDGIVDLNDASTKLNVQKRRLYDITNVLEGVDVLVKKSKNQVMLKGQTTGDQSRLELSRLDDIDKQLAKYIKVTEGQLHKLNAEKLGYVMYSDLRSIPKFRNKTVMAIKAPAYTKLDVPEKQMQMQMCSKHGEIQVFLCPVNADKEQQLTPPQPPPQPQQPRILPPIDPLLRDLQVDPNIGQNIWHTPPIPPLDIPMDCKPISTHTCRQITFAKDMRDPVMQSIGAPRNTSYHQPVAMLPIKEEDPSGQTQLELNMYLDCENKPEDTYHKDPMFCDFINLEPPAMSQYMPVLDRDESATDLFSSFDEFVKIN